MNRLLSLAIYLVALFLCIVVFITCTKEYSYEGGVLNGTAVYTLKDSTGTCLTNVIQGSYYENTVLKDTNTIQLQVNVITIGSYNIQTNTADGIYFNAFGNFTKTGIQTITLLGNGKPVSPGSFTFNIAVNPDCSFTVIINKIVPAVAKFSLAGMPGTCTDFIVGGVYEVGRGLTILNTVEVKVNVTAIGTYTLLTDTLDGISFSKSGTFTTTGLQTVTLRGFGSPKAARNLVFTPFTDSSTCSFSVTVTDPAPLATYVLESGYGNSESPCICTVLGTYKVGSLLTIANGLQMHVYVTVAGNFTIATNQVNGITFSYTGMFTVTGSQIVTLKAVGTPIASGKNTFVPEIVGPHPLGGEFCAFEVTTE